MSYGRPVTKRSPAHGANRCCGDRNNNQKTKHVKVSDIYFTISCATQMQRHMTRAAHTYIIAYKPDCQQDAGQAQRPSRLERRHKHMCNWDARHMHSVDTYAFLRTCTGPEQNKSSPSRVSGASQAHMHRQPGPTILRESFPYKVQFQQQRHRIKTRTSGKR